MKKSRKHISLSTVLALLILSVQTAFFPLHYYLTHHKAPLHAQIQHDNGQQQNLLNNPITSSLDDEGCYWCDLFAHQGYFIEKFTDIIFRSPDAIPGSPETLVYVSIKSPLPDSRGPPASLII